MLLFGGGLKILLIGRIKKLFKWVSIIDIWLVKIFVVNLDKLLIIVLIK